MKRFSRGLLLVLLILVIFSSFVFGFSGGSGTSNDPYWILDCSDLSSISNTGHYILLENITCPSYSTLSGEFTGTFDGRYFSISDLTEPLFYNVTGNVVNLNLIDVDINYIASSSDDIRKGGLAEFQNGGLIENVSVSGSIYVKNTYVGSGNHGVANGGGIIGELDGGVIKTSFVDVDLEVISADYLVSGGGIVGFHDFKIGSGQVLNSYSLGTITGDADTGFSCRIGGLEGESHLTTGVVTIDKSFSLMSTECSGGIDNDAGLVSWACYAKTSGANDYDNYYTNLYWSDDVNSYASYGIYRNHDSSNYMLKGIDSTPYVSFANTATFTNYDFTNVWEMCSGANYPTLQMQEACCVSPTTWYFDYDGDGEGNSSISISRCNAPEGFVATGGDCDDTNSMLNSSTAWFLDQDGDEYYASSQTQCAEPSGTGWTYWNEINLNSTCWVPEVLDGLNVVERGYFNTTCAEEYGYVKGGNDCNDLNSSIHPGAFEACNDGVDDDCDISTDDQCTCSAMEGGNLLDLVLLIDTSGSFKDELNSYNLSQKIDEIIAGLESKNYDVQFKPYIMYHDFAGVGDDFTNEEILNDMSTTLNLGDPCYSTLNSFSESCNSNSCVEAWGLAGICAIDIYPWRDDSIRVLMILGDEGPNGNDRQNMQTTTNQLIANATSEGVRIYSFYDTASTSAETYLNQATSQTDGGVYSYSGQTLIDGINEFVVDLNQIYGKETGICEYGAAECVNNIFQNIQGGIKPNVAGELCNGLDDDCDGIVDEGCDSDQDSFLDSLMSGGSPTCLTWSGSSNLGGLTCPSGGDPICQNDAGTSSVTCDSFSFNDCNDDNFDVNPGIIEEKFTKCTNGYDDDCDSDADENDSSCQINCSPSFPLAEVLRYSNHSIAGSEVGDKTDYEFYFPLCIDFDIFEEGLKSSCSSGFEKVLAVNLNTGLVGSPNYSDSSYDKFVCAKVNDCEIMDECLSTHTAVASLSGNTTDLNLVGPEFDGSYKLCCDVSERGVKFDYDGDGVQNEFSCSYISDGICPEDFENEEGQRVSCEQFHDPDCGWQSNIRGETKWRNLFTFNFSKKSYVVSVGNSDGALVLASNQSDDTENNIYTYDFSITSDVHVPETNTTIQFSYGTDEPVISFDGVELGVCGNSPCYFWNESSYVLIVKHSLSSHDLRVQFNYLDISLFLLYIVLFMVLVPLLIVLFSRKSHLKVHLYWGKFKHLHSKKKSDFEELVEYVEKRLRGGHNSVEIRSDLIKAGWKKHIIDIAIKGLHKKENKNLLKGYILACLDGGVRKSELYTTLISAGWTRDEVDEIFKGI